METFLIPFQNVPQDFYITLGNKEYRFINKFNSAPEGGWVIDILDAETDEPIVANIPMVTGCDLLEQYEYLGIGGKLIVYTDGDELAVPSETNLGTESNVYFKTEVA